MASTADARSALGSRQMPVPQITLLADMKPRMPKMHGLVVNGHALCAYMELANGGLIGYIRRITQRYLA